jgi:hypothetical protein
MKIAKAQRKGKKSQALILTFSFNLLIFILKNHEINY